ncbi:hypothetical protein GTR02_09875 [Kineococcus sp. R8]|uniref:hypothetical protein n=1 Tax=Kineococcus siccus TaxID=2696567 RepID=UPI001412053A|nr:hypothetical protein [Kineococcus siccus]NAZ82125.1 hypothetical protein [Kineococcus siccus]
MLDPAPVIRRLPRAGLAWRSAVAVAFLVLLVLGTVQGNDDRWPFAPMSQYAFAVDLDGEIRSTRIEAVTTAGTRTVVPLTPGGVGLRRAEVEGQLGRFVDDPALLEAVAAAAAQRHPGRPRYARLELRQTVSRLVAGEVVGPPQDVLLSAWDVPDPQHPLGCCR